MSEPSETPDQRRARYLRLAAEAEAIAGQCRGADLREAYIGSCAVLDALAKDIKSDDGT